MTPAKHATLMRLWREDLQHVVLPDRPTPGYEVVPLADYAPIDGWGRPGWVVQPRMPRTSWNYALRIWRHLRDWGWSGADIGRLWQVSRQRVGQIERGM